MYSYYIIAVLMPISMQRSKIYSCTLIISLFCLLQLKDLSKRNFNVKKYSRYSLATPMPFTSSKIAFPASLNRIQLTKTNRSNILVFTILVLGRFIVHISLLLFSFRNEPNTASFCLLSFFSHDKYSTNTINDKSVDGVLGTRTQCSRMVGADESTELWRHPFCYLVMERTGKSTNNRKVTLCVFSTRSL